MILSEHKLQQTPLCANHVSLKAQMVPFGGWLMPLQYTGILSEFEQTRRRASVFDTCHMSEFKIEGDGRQSGLDRVVTCRIADMPTGACRYGLMLNGQGGVIDDLIVFRVAQDKWFIVANGATIAKDENNFKACLTDRAEFRNITFETGKIDLQGPLSREILKNLVPGIERLEYYTFDSFDILGEKSLVSRTGYSGELGYEIYFPAARIKELWNLLLENENVKPAGLGARDVLRMEMGYSLYGNDIDDTISPLEAGLERFIDFEKEFIGKEALLEQKKRGLGRKMIAFVAQSRRSPRRGHKIYSAGSKEIGTVTSGAFSPSIKKGIGMGLVDRAYPAEQGNILFGDEKNKNEAQITKRPFYKQGSLKK